MIRKIFMVGAAVLTLASCGTKQQVVQQKGGNIVAAKDENPVGKAATEKASLAFVQKVYDRNLYQKNVVSGISFTLDRNGKQITVPGELRMRKDEVIRLQLQLPLLRTEVGRIEFTKDYVLFIDRIHKQYVKAKYSDVSFLNNNGINFYSLQALFWNELFLPGKSRVGEAGLSKYEVDFSDQKGTAVETPVVLKDGKMTYTWRVESATGRIATAQAKYQSTAHGVSMLTWGYSNFAKFGSKEFPLKNMITIQTQATKQQKTVKAAFELNEISDKADWEAISSPSEKYKEVKVEDILGKLMNF